MVTAPLFPALSDIARMFFTRRQATPTEPRDIAAEDRERRAFIDEMISRNPDAFSSDLDIQFMMSVYCGRF